MKAVRIVKPEQLELIEVEKPVINEKDNVLVCLLYTSDAADE